MVELCIRELLKSRGIKQKDFAAQMGMSACRLTTVCNGQEVSLKTLEQIADALSVEVADLIKVPSGYQHWMTVYGQETDGNITCPKCGQRFQLL